MGEVALPPKEYPHTEVGLEQMAIVILELGEDTRGLMEATGRYHEQWQRHCMSTVSA